MPLVDVEVVDGVWQWDKPAIVLDAELARRAIENGELHNIILDSLGALELSGKAIVFVAESDDDA
jgi:uncharacterized protein (DUF2249 family)